MNAAAREWTAVHLPWIAIALLSLWLPPVIYDVAVYRGWSNPGTLVNVLELTLICAAMPGLWRRRASAWRLLVGSRFAVLAQTLWLCLLNSRLNGLVPTLLTKPIVEAVLGLAVALYVLIQIRGLYR
jgi:hypothetical protein